MEKKRHITHAGRRIYMFRYFYLHLFFQYTTLRSFECVLITYYFKNYMIEWKFLMNILFVPTLKKHCLPLHYD